MSSRLKSWSHIDGTAKTIILVKPCDGMRWCVLELKGSIMASLNCITVLICGCSVSMSMKEVKRLDPIALEEGN
jgi:hypothetical protein